MKVYVLYDLSEYTICAMVLGVFDHADISNSELKTYFGEFERTKFIDVRDYGMEWEMWLKTEDGETSILQLHEYEINQID